MLPWNLNCNNIDYSLGKAIHKDKLYFYRAWDCENMHLEHFLDLKIETWPIDRRLICL